MNMVVMAEIICAVFTAISLIVQFREHDTEKNTRLLKINTLVILLWLLVDAASYCTDFSYFPTLLTFSLGSLSLLIFCCYCDVYIGRKTTLKKWCFLFPKTLSVFCIIASIAAFLMGKVVVYENGAAAAVNGNPLIVQLMQYFVMIYVLVMVLIKGKAIGVNNIILLGLLDLAPMIAAVAYIWFGEDYTVVISSVSVMAIVMFLQAEWRSENLKERAAHDILARNNARILALEDNFVSLYDLELENGEYELYIKSDANDYGITDRMFKGSNFYEDAVKNVMAVTYPEDADGLIKVLTESYIRNALEKDNHFDYYYRLLAEGTPVWAKIRIVYKDAQKRRVIIGAFNAEEEMEIRQKEENLRRDLLERMSGDEGVFLIDCVNDARKTIHDRVHSSEEFSDINGYSDNFRRYIDTFVAESDRDVMRPSISPSYLMDRLKNENEFSVRYREAYSGAFHWFEMHVARVSDTTVLQSFKDIDERVQIERAQKAISEDFFAIYIADLDNDVIRVIKRSPVFRSDSTLNENSFSKMITMFISGLNEPDRLKWRRLNTANGVREFLADQDKRELLYESTYREGGLSRATWFVLERVGGEAAAVCLAFSNLEKEAKKRFLGAVPISSDILAEENIGMWAFELDEGQPPRMYGDGTMLRLVGLDHHVSPEEMYHAWYDHIDEGSYGIVNDAVNKMASGEHAEVQYPWHHPNGTTMIVRCGGIRNPEYTKGMRIEGTHQNMTEVVHFDDEERKALEENNVRLFALEDNFMSLYDVELESGHYVSYDRDDFYKRNVSDNVVSATEFFEDLRTNVERVVWEEDREAVYKIQTREAIIRGLSENDHIDHYYRIITENGPMWLKMRIVYKDADKRNVILGIFNAGEEMAARQKEEQYNAMLLQTNARLFALEDNFESLYDVELESGHYDVFVKGDFFKNNVLDKLSVPHDYFEELRDNIDAVIYEEDRDGLYHTLTRESIRRELDGNDHFDYYYRINSENGPTWLKIRIVYKNAEKENIIIGVFNAAKDVEAKQIEEKNAQLENNMRMIGGLASGYNALYYININDNILHIYTLDEEKYPGSREIFEGEEKDFYKIIGGYGLSEQVHPDDRHLFEDFTPEGIREKLTGRKKYSIRFRARTDSGYRWDEMELTKYEAIDEQANAVAVGFTDRDADIRREQEYQLQLEAARIAADAANQSKSNFLFNMSHDIRTPMNAIRGFTTMAKKNADDKDKVIGYLDKIDISGQQLLTLINQVLEMARIESGKIEFEEKPINVRKEFNSMVTVLSEQAKSNGLKFIHTLGNIEHNDILADEARMSSIALNITGNAMKYTPEGGTVEYELKEIPGRKPGYAAFVFTVADTGIGMSEEYMKKLYEPFSREKSSTVSKIQGTGLGLPIVKSIIDLIGGNIEVRSELGKGTRFDITVDFKIDENAGKAAEENDDIGLVSFKDRRVLLVEDNEMNREIARDILEEQGIIVEDAEDGDVAVAMVQAIVERGEFHYYDFILMDVQMPRMNGYEATKAIRAIPGPDGVRIPIIAMTANAFEEDRQNALAAGMDEHLAKPIDVNKAFRTIAKLLK